MYELHVDIAPGVRFVVKEETMGDLADDLTKLGAPSGQVADQIGAVFSALPHGAAATTVARGLGARVTEVKHETNSPREAERPWETDAGDDDPWGSDSDGSEEPTHTDTRPAPSRAARSENGASSGGSSRPKTFTDRWGSKYTFDLPEAPECDHGWPAARKQGKSRAGKRYTVWVCSLAGTEDQWGDKCEFSKFPDKR